MATLGKKEADMQNPQIGGEILGAKIERLQEEARRDGRARLAHHHRRAFRSTGAWRQAIGMRLVDAGVRLLGPHAEASHGAKLR